jgi:hypothetical protein
MRGTKAATVSKKSRSIVGSYLRTGTGEYAPDEVSSIGYEAHLEATRTGFVYAPRRTLRVASEVEVRALVRLSEPVPNLWHLPTDPARIEMLRSIGVEPS